MDLHRLAAAKQRRAWHCLLRRRISMDGLRTCIERPALLRKSNAVIGYGKDLSIKATALLRNEKRSGGEAMISNALYEMQRRRAELHRVDKKIIGGKKR